MKISGSIKGVAVVCCLLSSAAAMAQSSEGNAGKIHE
jgi:hypothetical protein